MINYEDVGKRIRYYRQSLGMTQEQLAFDVETSAAYISNIERAIKKPSLQKLLQVAEALDVSIEDLLGPDYKLLEKNYNNHKNAYILSHEDKERLLDHLFSIIERVMILS